ncbi:MAG TPA: hypothetical protein VMI56_25395 [Reyranella sp.]|nr:hypothetical protein [Reyranella sp.]
MLPDTSYFHYLKQELNRRGVRVSDSGFSKPPFYLLRFQAEGFQPAISQAIYTDEGEGPDGYALFIETTKVHRVVTGVREAMIADADLISGRPDISRSN